MQVQVTQNTEALQGARTEVNDLRRQIQALEIDLDSQRSLVSSFSIFLCVWWFPSPVKKNICDRLNSTLPIVLVASLAPCPRCPLPPGYRWPCVGYAGQKTDDLKLFCFFCLLQKASLEGTLRETEMRYNGEIENLNAITMQLEAELTQLRNNIQQQTQEYEALLNMKMKLEAEIATYRRLLEGGDFKWV